MSLAPSAISTRSRSGRWPDIASTSAATIVSSVPFFGCGIRAMRTVESRAPSPSWSETEAQLASRYPPPPPLIGAITASSDTATVHAVSGTSSVSSRRRVSNSQRRASQRAESVFASRSSELFDGIMWPNAPSTSSASRDTKCAVSIAPWRAAYGVQSPSTMPTGPDCYWLYVVTDCATAPELQKPIRDPARFPWHEVSKVGHYVSGCVWA